MPELPIEVRGFLPVTREQLYRVHDRDYVDGVLDLRLSNGFGNRSPQVARSLPYTSGAMLAAAREAIANGSVAVRAGVRLPPRRLPRRRRLLHLQRPDGGGRGADPGGRRVAAWPSSTATTTTATARTTSSSCCRLRCARGSSTSPRGAVTPTRARRAHFLSEVLPNWLASVSDAQVLLYQAGADAHIDDPLGGWMTTEQLRERDRIVFDWAAANKVPVAWDLAGGYQKDEDGGIEPVLRIHRNTMQACAARFARH